jgi:hypothetical protein
MTKIVKNPCVDTPLLRKLLGRYYISPSPPATFVFAPLHLGAKTLQKRYIGVTKRCKFGKALQNPKYWRGIKVRENIEDC